MARRTIYSEPRQLLQLRKLSSQSREPISRFIIILQLGGYFLNPESNFPSLVVCYDLKDRFTARRTILQFWNPSPQLWKLISAPKSQTRTCKYKCTHSRTRTHTLVWFRRLHDVPKVNVDKNRVARYVFGIFPSHVIWSHRNRIIYTSVSCFRIVTKFRASLEVSMFHSKKNRSPSAVLVLFIWVSPKTVVTLSNFIFCWLFCQ